LSKSGDFNVKKRNLKKGLEVADDGESREW